MLSLLRRGLPAVWCDRQVRKSRTAAGAALVVGALLINVGAASPRPDFTVDVNPVSFPVKRPLLLVADKLTGNYHEVFTITEAGAGSGTFAVTGYWDIGQLVHADGSVPYSAELSRLGVDYALYGLFSYAGTFVIDGTNGRFVVTEGSLTLSLDRGVNTGKTLPDVAPNPITLTKSPDDAVLATASLVSGAGHFRFGGLANGDFGLAFSPLTLTPVGTQYFVAPTPWDAGVLFKGHFNDFEASLIQRIDGSADAVLAP
jgi:hypothetical protein